MIRTENHYINEKIDKKQFNSIHATFQKINKRTEKEEEEDEGREKERGKRERRGKEGGREISLFLSLSFR